MNTRNIAVSIVPNFVAMFLGVYIYREYLKPMILPRMPTTDDTEGTPRNGRTEWQKSIGVLLNAELTDKIIARLCKYQVGEVDYENQTFEFYTDVKSKEPSILSFNRKERFTPTEIATFIFTQENETNAGEVLKIVGYDRYTDGSPFAEYKIYKDLKKTEYTDLYKLCGK